MLSKASVEPTTYMVDLIDMLDGNEILNFCFNETRGMSSCIVTVMLKNLKIYNIDYDKKRIVKQVL